MRKAPVYTILFIILSFISFLILDWERDTKIDEYLKSKTVQYKQNYEAHYDDYITWADLIFNSHINTKETISIFKDAYKSDVRKKEQLRKKLYDHLKDVYNLLKSYDIKQLHFHLPDNESFLRFHRPGKFGDNLTGIRDTVAYVNKNKKKINGFEEGRIFNGYRFIFPLFYKDEHIGSVEISYSTLALSKEFMNSFNVIPNFLIPKALADKKLFEEEKSNYISSIIDGYYMERSIVEAIKKKRKEKVLLPLASKTKKEFEKRIKNEDSFTLYDPLRKELMTFISVKNPIHKTISGVFVIRSGAEVIDQKNKNFKIFLILTMVSLLVVLYLIYKEDIYVTKIDENNKKLSSVFKDADSGIALIDLKGRFLEVNDAYSRILGYSQDEIVKISCMDLSRKEDIPKIIETLIEAYKLGHISKERKICIKKDGSVVHIEFSLTLLPSKDAFIVVVNPLEDKLKLERLNNNLQKEVERSIEDLRLKDAMLAQQSKLAAMGEMIDSIAHQWMQPVGIIKMKIQTMQADHEYKELTDERIEEFINSSLGQIDHLVNTMNEFRRFFRPSEIIEEVSLHEMIDTSILLVKDELVKNSIKTVVNGDTEAKVKLNSAEFKHVLINIINNAKDAFIQNGTKERLISFYVSNKEGKVFLSISDNAGGIDKEVIDHIFEPNFTTKEQGKGTGIGLYMSKQIIDKNNAQIKVQNINDGVCFIISFIC
jgi:PAS domain S-box-containing protein